MEVSICFLYSVLYLLAFVNIPICSTANYDGRIRFTAMNFKDVDMEYGEKLSSLSEEEFLHPPTANVKNHGLNLGPIREINADRFHENMAWLHPSKTLHHRRVLRSASSMETSGRLFHLNPTWEPPKLAKYARKAKNKIEPKRAVRYIDYDTSYYDSDSYEDSESYEDSSRDLTSTPSTTISSSKKRRKPTTPSNEDSTTTVTRRPTAEYDDYTPTYKSPKIPTTQNKQKTTTTSPDDDIKDQSPPSTKKPKKPTNTVTDENITTPQYVSPTTPTTQDTKPSRTTSSYGDESMTPPTKKPKKPSKNTPTYETTYPSTTIAYPEKETERPKPSKETTEYSPPDTKRTVKKRPSGIANFPLTSKMYNTIKEWSGKKKLSGKVVTVRSVKKRPSAIAYFQPTSKMYNTIKEWNGKKKLSDKVVTVAGLQRPVDSTSRARCTTSKPLSTLNPNFVPSSSEVENNKPYLPLDEGEKDRKPNKYRAPDMHVPPNNYIDDEK